MKPMYRVALTVVAAVLLTTTLTGLVSASETDARIESSAKKTYVFQTYLKDDAIKIESKDGIVALTGTVAEESHKSLAQETVMSLPGVTRVESRLEIKGERAAENSDSWVGMKVKATLLFHRNLSASKTDVQVKDGVVTLRGEAANSAQMDLATEYAKDVDGVKEVKNEMTVSKTPMHPPEKTMGQKLGAVGDKMGEKVGAVGETVGDKMGTVGEAIDDASITALVKMTLMYHRSTSALQTKVETNKGLVTVSGKAKNPAEKDLVTKFTQDVYGVQSVINNMTIEDPKTN